MSPTAAVFAATGAQGSAVVGSLLTAGYKVTAFTRDTSKPEAKELEKLGAETVKIDMNHPETYKPALQGKDAVFVNADFWSFYLNNGYDGSAAAASEIEQAKAAIQAAVDGGVKHIVYSTLDGGYGCVHWDSKEAVSQWARENKLPVTNLYTTFYYSGINKFNMLTANDDGTFTLGLPAPDSTVVPGIAIEQLGKWVVKALSNPEQYLGKSMYAINDNKTIGEMAQILSDWSGKTVKTNQMPEAYFLSDDFKNTVGAELWSNWKMFYDGNPKRDLEGSRALIDSPWTFEDWAKQDEGIKKTLGL